MNVFFDSGKEIRVQAVSAKRGVAMERDPNLLGNFIIEDAIAAMYKSLTAEHLVKALTTIRERMQEGGHLVVAVKPGNEQGLELRTVSTPDGQNWFAAFTCMEEEIKKKQEYVSGFTAEIEKLLTLTLNSEEVVGIIVNPWEKPLKLTKEHIRLIVGGQA